jgi:hypothetical protein
VKICNENKTNPKGDKMQISGTDNFWQSFALSGDPMAYLDYTRERNDRREKANQRNENNKSTRIGN